MTGKRVTDRKVKSVSVLKTPLYQVRSGDGSFTPKIDHLAGDYLTEDWGRTWKKTVAVPVYLDGSDLDEVNESLRNAAEGLTNVYLDIGLDGDGYSETSVRGRRDATPDEVAEVLRFLAWDKDRVENANRSLRETVIDQAKRLGIKPGDLA